MSVRDDHSGTVLHPTARRIIGWYLVMFFVVAALRGLSLLISR